MLKSIVISFGQAYILKVAAEPIKLEQRNKWSRCRADKTGNRGISAYLRLLMELVLHKDSNKQCFYSRSIQYRNGPINELRTFILMKNLFNMKFPYVQWMTTTEVYYLTVWISIKVAVPPFWTLYVILKWKNYHTLPFLNKTFSHNIYQEICCSKNFVTTFCKLSQTTNICPKKKIDLIIWLWLQVKIFNSTITDLDATDKEKVAEHNISCG